MSILAQGQAKKHLDLLKSIFCFQILLIKCITANLCDVRGWLEHGWSNKVLQVFVAKFYMVIKTTISWYLCTVDLLCTYVRQPTEVLAILINMHVHIWCVASVFPVSSPVLYIYSFHVTYLCIPDLAVIIILPCWQLLESLLIIMVQCCTSSSGWYIKEVFTSKCIYDHSA